MKPDLKKRNKQIKKEYRELRDIRGYEQYDALDYLGAKYGLTINYIRFILWAKNK